MTKNARAEGVVKEAIKRGRVVKEVMRERHFDDNGTLDCRGGGATGRSYIHFAQT